MVEMVVKGGDFAAVFLGHDCDEDGGHRDGDLIAAQFMKAFAGIDPGVLLDFVAGDDSKRIFKLGGFGLSFGSLTANSRQDAAEQRKAGRSKDSMVGITVYVIVIPSAARDPDACTISGGMDFFLSASIYVRSEIQYKIVGCCIRGRNDARYRFSESWTNSHIQKTTYRHAKC
jgi:hypothetical protein